jgi:hypothetical protein
LQRLGSNAVLIPAFFYVLEVIKILLKTLKVTQQIRVSNSRLILRLKRLLFLGWSLIHFQVSSSNLRE